MQGQLIAIGKYDIILILYSLFPSKSSKCSVTCRENKVPLIDFVPVNPNGFVHVAIIS